MNTKIKKLDDFGFTLIELMISIALFGILISLIFSVFSVNMNTVDKINKKVEIQQQAQFIFNFIEEKIIESKGIIHIEDINGSMKHDTNELVRIKKIIFQNNETRKEKGYIFNLIKDYEAGSYNLKYGIWLSGTGTVEVGNYIENIEVEPMPSDKIYTEANGIVIRINFIFDGEKDSVENRFFYRNSGRGYKID